MQDKIWDYYILHKMILKGKKYHLFHNLGVFIFLSSTILFLIMFKNTYILHFVFAGV